MVHPVSGMADATNYPGTDGRNGGHTVRQNIGDDTEVATVVTRAIASLEGSDPESLQPPLHDVVDPDALDRIFQPLDGNTHRQTGRVEFPIQDYEITVWGDGTVVVDPD